MMSDVSALRNKIKRLEKFRHACNEAGLEGDFKNAARSLDKFISECLAFIEAPEKRDELSQAIISQYNEVTAALITLANAANIAGINLHTELRETFGAINDLMGAMSLARDGSLER